MRGCCGCTRATPLEVGGEIEVGALAARFDRAGVKEHSLGELAFRERGRAGNEIATEVDGAEREGEYPSSENGRGDGGEDGCAGGDSDVDSGTGDTAVFAGVFGLAKALNG